MFVISNVIVIVPCALKLASDLSSSSVFSLSFFTRLNGGVANEFTYSSIESFKIDNCLVFDSFFCASFASVVSSVYKFSAAFNKSNIL